MKSVLSRPVLQNKRKTNGFDLSQRRQFSCMLGQLLPVWKDFSSPGDHYKLNSRTLIRTEAIETAAFVELVHHNEWYFVPAMQIYRFWNEFFYGTNDVMTNFVSPEEINSDEWSLPTLSIFGNLMDITGNFTDPPEVSGEPPVFINDDFGIPRIWNAARLADMLEYGSVSANPNMDIENPPTFKDKWFPMFYLAYHKIFHSHYLNTDYFANNQRLYNVDSYHGTGIPNDIAVDIISTIHYRPYRRDYFTSMQPSPIFNNRWANSVVSFFGDNTSPGQSGLNYDGVTNASIRDYKAYVVPSSSNDSNLPGLAVTDSVYSSYANAPESGAISVGSLRAMFALDRLARVTASTGSHYYEQVLAHSGYKIPIGLRDEAYKIGSQITPIQVTEVVATSSNDSNLPGATIGDIAGKGFALTSNSDDLEFEAPCHGVLMCISSIEVLPIYASMRSDVVNRYLKPFDFFREELDNVGMQPLWDPYASGSLVGVQTSNFIGWQPRYTELKTKFDVVNESMFATYRNSWVGYKQFVYQGINGVSTNYTPSLFDMFYICPQYLNNIFLKQVPYYGNTPLSYDTRDGEYWNNRHLAPDFIYNGDNFLVNMYLHAFKVSNMSVHSLPKFQ